MSPADSDSEEEEFVPAQKKPLKVEESDDDDEDEEFAPAQKKPLKAEESDDDDEDESDVDVPPAPKAKAKPEDKKEAKVPPARKEDAEDIIAALKEKPKHEKKTNPLSIVISGLPYDKKATMKQVHEDFGECGKIKEVRQLKRGMALVIFETEEAVEKALKLDGTKSKHKGLTLKVKRDGGRDRGANASQEKILHEQFVMTMRSAEKCGDYELLMKMARNLMLDVTKKSGNASLLLEMAISLKNKADIQIAQANAETKKESKADAAAEKKKRKEADAGGPPKKKAKIAKEAEATEAGDSKKKKEKVAKEAEAKATPAVETDAAPGKKKKKAKKSA